MPDTVLFEKNYRLQDIQLSKIRRRPYGLWRDLQAFHLTARARFRKLSAIRNFRSRSAAHSLPLAEVRLRWLHQTCRGPPSPFRASARQPPPCGLARRAVARSRITRAEAGGEYRARTGDLLVANQALSQLS